MPGILGGATLPKGGQAHRDWRVWNAVFFIFLALRCISEVLIFPHLQRSHQPQHATLTPGWLSTVPAAIWPRPCPNFKRSFQV